MGKLAHYMHLGRQETEEKDSNTQCDLEQMRGL